MTKTASTSGTYATLGAERRDEVNTRVMRCRSGQRSKQSDVNIEHLPVVGLGVN